MAIDTPARHIYEGDGFTRVFPIPTYIRGDDYIRIEIDGEYQVDRSLWDIVNNSIIFTIAPIDGSSVDVQVATSTEALSELGNSTNVDIVAANIINVNNVGNSIDNVDIVANNIDDVITTSDNIGDINITSNDIANINIVAKYIQEGNASIGSNGQLLGNSVIKGVAYLANSTNENLTVLSGTNGYSVDSLTLNDGATITVENNAVYKIL